MPTLAPKLPWNHPFAGGYPRVGGQALPTDPDAIDYLNRVAAADGAGVEVGVAMAVDTFIKGCKSDGIWDAIKASCIMCGARTISGALVPLVGPSPTAYPQPVNFVSSDYSRTTGLKGDGATKYLDSNRANDADGQDDQHLAAYCSSGTITAGEYLIGTTDTASPSFSLAGYRVYSRSLGAEGALGGGTGLYAFSRSSGSGFSYTQAGGSVTFVGKGSSSVTISQDSLVFAYTDGSGVAAGFADDRIAFYSIGSSLDLAALDNRVSTLVSAIAAAI